MNRTNINDAQIIQITEEYGTPCYIYDANVIKRHYKNLQKVMSGMGKIFYSLKANPNLTIAALLRKQGASAEVCSLAELEIARQAGFPADRIIYVGPAKSDEELQACLQLNILAIVCESMCEIRRVARLAKRYNIIANIAIRINPSFAVQSAPLKMGGVASQFGIDSDQLDEVINFCLITPAIKVIGLHVYNATRILDAEVIHQNTRNILTLFEKWYPIWQKTLQFIDIGGGVGVNYFADEKECDISQLAVLLNPLISDFKERYPQIKIFMESGRYLVANSGLFVTKVKVVKESKDKKYVVTDGGTNCHMAAVGIGGVFKRNFPIYAILQEKTLEQYSYQIAGPLCTPGDVVGKDVILPKVQVGDLIVITVSGAYGPSASPVLFLSHGYPAEVIVNQTQSFLIRKRDSISDMIVNQYLVNFEETINGNKGYLLEC